MVGAAPAQLFAQGGYGSVLVGTWSTTLVQTDGQPFASIFIQFRPDGRYQKRMIVRGGTVDTFGSYQFDPQQSVIHYRAEDYQPRTLPPVEPMGQWLTMPVQFQSQNLMFLQDASGPIRWIRQN